MLSKENKEKISLMMQSMNIEDIIELKKLLDSRKDNCYQEMISKLDRLKIERKRMTDEINSIRNQLHLEASRLRLEGDVVKSRELSRLAAGEEPIPVIEKAFSAAKEISKIKVQPGDYITFGHYPQGIGDDTVSPIVWKVLSTDGNTALLLSKYVLDSNSYNNTEKSISFEESGLCDWLNKSFFNDAFTDDEKRSIVQFGKKCNVGILSLEELVKYLDSEEERRCYGTIYALTKGAEHFIDSTCTSYFLRNEQPQPKHLSVITPLGGVCPNKEITDRKIGVRPAITVRISDSDFK